MNIEQISNKINELKAKKTLNAADKIELKKLEKELNKINSPVESSGVFVTEDINYDTSRVSYVELDKIILNPNQPRKVFDQDLLQNLSESIKNHGLLQPIVVADQNGSYLLVAGERRYRAHKLANISKIKAIIVPNLSDLEIKELSIIENIQRKDLHCIEEAIAFKELQELNGLSIRQLAEKLNLEKNYVHSRITLSKYSDDCKDFILKNDIINVSKLLKILDTEDTVHKILLEKLAKKELTNEDIEKYNVNKITKLPDEKKQTKPKNVVDVDHDKFDDNPDFSHDKKLAKIEELTEKINEKEETLDENIDKASVVKQSESFLIKSLGDVINITIDRTKLTGKDLESILDTIKSL